MGRTSTAELFQSMHCWMTEVYFSSFRTTDTDVWHVWNALTRAWLLQMPTFLNLRGTTKRDIERSLSALDIESLPFVSSWGVIGFPGSWSAHEMSLGFLPGSRLILQAKTSNPTTMYMLCCGCSRTSFFTSANNLRVPPCIIQNKTLD